MRYTSRNMSVPERPEIPDHLQESVRSAAAYEQDARRDFQIVDRARVLQIPKESLDRNATVERYVTVIRDASAAAERFGPNAELGRFMRDDSRERIRLHQAYSLYEAEVQILEEGFPTGVPEQPWKRIERDDLDGFSLTARLDAVVRPFGFAVKELNESAWTTDDSYWEKVKPPPVSGVWTGGGFRVSDLEAPWDRGPGKDHEWFSADMPNERHDPEHLRALADEASRLGLEPDSARHDPLTHTLLTGLVYGRQLVAETADVAGLPPAPGLMPPAEQRLNIVVPLNRLAVALVEDAVRPGSLSPEEFAAELLPVVGNYGLTMATLRG